MQVAQATPKQRRLIPSSTRRWTLRCWWRADHPTREWRRATRRRGTWPCRTPISPWTASWYRPGAGQHE